MSFMHFFMSHDKNNNNKKKKKKKHLTIALNFAKVSLRQFEN